MINKVFVYGTLMTGFQNHSVVKDYIIGVEEGEIEGQIYHLPEGYPAVIRGLGRVKGELLTLKAINEALEAMDILEDYQEGRADNLYERIIAQVVTDRGRVEAYCYFWPEANRRYLEDRGILVNNGSWTDFISG